MQDDIKDPNLEAARSLYQTGKDAFERGQYRQSVQALEKAVSLLPRGSKFGGEAQIWLVTAYEAAGQVNEAIALCEQVARHPSYETRKEGKRLLYILKAPRLKTRPEWLTQIPDLSNLEEGEKTAAYARNSAPPRPRSPKSQPDPEPIDLSQVNTRDNGFIWVTLVAIALLLGGLYWFN